MCSCGVSCLLRVVFALAGLMLWTLAVLTYYNPSSSSSSSSFRIPLRGLTNHESTLGYGCGNGHGQGQRQGATSTPVTVTTTTTPAQLEADSHSHSQAARVEQENIWATSQMCDPSQPVPDDGRYYVASEMITGGYNNQWNTLFTLFERGVFFNRTVILPAMIFTRHLDTTQNWESVFDISSVRHPHPSASGFRIVTWAWGMRQCHCRLVHTASLPDEKQDYSPAKRIPKCIWSQLPLEGWRTGTMRYPNPDPNKFHILKAHCIKHNVVVSSLSLVPWLSSLASSLVSLVSGDFVGFHLRLGDFRGMCAGEDKAAARSRFPEMANVCPLTREILDAVQRYCQQSCILHHYKGDHNNETATHETCTKEQQQTYTCNVLIATNPNIIDRIIKSLHNATILFQQQHSQMNFVMNVKYFHVAGLIRAYDLTSSLRSTWSGSWLESRIAANTLDRTGIIYRDQVKGIMNHDQVVSALHDAGKGPHLTAFELSVLEQYILSEATFFLGNPASTWSRWVYHRRIAHGRYNGWFTFHRWNECADWRVTAQDRLLMDQASKQPEDYYRPRTITNTQDDPFQI